MMPTIHIYGDWEKAKLVIERLPMFFAELTDSLAENIAKKFYDRLIFHFKSQDLPLKPLSEWYRRWKEKMGLDTRILLATHEMFEAIHLENLGKGKRFVGIRGGKIHKMAKIDIALLALVHEYGRLDRSLPARPVYRPTFEEIKKMLNEIISATLKEVEGRVFA